MMSMASIQSIQDSFVYDALAQALVERWLSPSRFLKFFDVDGSGELDIDEYMGALDEFRLKVDRDMARAAFFALDENGSGTISSKELEKALNDRIEVKTKEAQKKSGNDKRNTLYDDAPPLKWVSLVAHNDMKPALMNFVARHMWFFTKVPVITTGSTGRALEKKLGIKIFKKVSSGPLGGDQEIGARVSQGDVGIIFFFRDPLSAHAHQSDIQALGRLCDAHDCANCSNPSTAEAMMEALARTPVGQILKFADAERHESAIVKKYKKGQKKVIRRVSMTIQE